MPFDDDVRDTERPPRVDHVAAARDRILSALEGLGPDELAVLALIAERLATGRRQYGELRLSTDRRDFGREALEEASDGLVYVAAALLRSGAPS